MVDGVCFHRSQMVFRSNNVTPTNLDEVPKWEQALMAAVATAEIAGFSGHWKEAAPALGLTLGSLAAGMAIGALLPQN